ncbi:Phenylacetate-coenzyme A ligase [Pelotomaculum schinkii]|uniref:Phenylacetate-coenzyme A ligase n=1 Tax=Pelotomaculum schinkii TaxID=78350 RepID=A0A4Y7R8B6_9FIRM|nr:AMP-binding protein [Pelotomaculum schinkii]TEB05022.1 Phenylacetate-coenzyme A ligase [Pelotomaculum schinkii]
MNCFWRGTDIANTFADAVDRQIKKTPLDAWINRKINGSTNNPLTREQIEQYQVKKLNDLIRYAKDRSSFYRNHLAKIKSTDITSLDEFRLFPFTTSKNLTEDPLSFICVPQQQISRIKTVTTSGTTGNPKRLFLTDGDQEETMDFFHHGMSNLSGEGDRILILLPGERPGSIGDLLYKALGRMNAVAVKHGLVTDPESTLSVIEKERINVLVGIPVQVLSLVRYSEFRHPLLTQMKSVLLSTDYVPHTGYPCNSRL